MSVSLTNRGLTTVSIHDQVLSPNGLTSIDSIPSENDRAVVDIISFNEAVSRSHGQSVIVADSVTFTDRVRRTFVVSVSDSLSFSDHPSPIAPQSVSSTITFAETASVDVVHTVKDVLTFGETVSVRGSTFNVGVHDILSLSEAPIGVNGHVADVLVFTETALFFRQYNVSDALTFVEQVSVFRARSVSDTLTFSEQAQAEKLHLVSDRLTFNESVRTSNILHVSAHDLLVFSEQILGITPHSARSCFDDYFVVLGTRDRIRLTWPFISPILTLDLRNPNFGNSSSIETYTKIRRTRSNQLGIVRGASWPVIERLTVKFSALSKTESNAFVDFVTRSAAFEIGYLDQEARQWRGYITDVTLTTTQVGIGCQYTAGFSFRGRLA